MTTIPKTILVVDDDEAVRRFSLTALRIHGYRTLEAFDGDSGLATFLRHKEDVDLILTDIVMTHPGPEMVDKIWHTHPSAKVVFVSETTGHGALPEHMNMAPFLRKPFTTESLLKCVRKCLEGTSVEQPGQD